MMAIKIIKVNDSEKPLHHVSEGSTFIYNNQVYMKLDQDQQSCEHNYCVLNLQTGKLDYFNHQMIVIDVDCELHVRKRGF